MGSGLDRDDALAMFVGGRRNDGNVWLWLCTASHKHVLVSDAKALRLVAPGHEAPQNQILEADAVWGLPKRSSLRMNLSRFSWFKSTQKFLLSYWRQF